MQSDIEIAQAARPEAHRHAIREALGIPEESLDPRGRHIGKVAQPWLDTLADRPDGKLVLVTAISPTPAGEGKTTTTVGLGDALNRIGKRAIVCLREPSLGPVFGMKGGAAGGGHAQVVPMEQINLHFTGDFHAITAAHNLLAAMIDNHIHWGNALGIDTAARSLAPGAGRERPQHCVASRDRSGRTGQRHADARAASTSRSPRSDGDPVPRRRPRRPQGAAGAHRGRRRRASGSR